MRRICTHSKTFDEKSIDIREFERSVVQEFENAGWNKDDLSMKYKFSLTIGEKVQIWSPDIMLLNGKQKLAVVDIKPKFWMFTVDKLLKLNYIIQSGEIPFLILSTGNYYEIYMANDIMNSEKIGG